MLITYAFSIQGDLHKKVNKPCQDFSAVLKISETINVLVTADGVGSAALADVGAKTAVKSVINFWLKTNANSENVDFMSKIKQAFQAALDSLNNLSEESGNELSEYDTTLDVGILAGDVLYYGHSGDGGIIARNDEGDYIAVTKPQKGENGNTVIPLRFGYHFWEFGRKENIVAVLLMTDGIWNICNPYLLRFASVEIYRNILRLLSDYNCYRNEVMAEESIISGVRSFIENRMDDSRYIEIMMSGVPEQLENQKENIKESIKKICYPLQFIESVNDDKTIAAIINTDIPLYIKDIEYYCEEKWNEYQEQWNRLAYPSMYDDEKCKKA